MEKCDIVVVGGGTAAHEAAVAAKRNGAQRVVMLEKAPVTEAGGNARFGATGFRFVHAGAEELRAFLPDIDAALYDRFRIPPYPAEQFTDDLLRVTQNRIDPELMGVLVGDSNAALHWMREMGIKFEPATNSRVLDGVHYFEPGCSLNILGGAGIQFIQWEEIRQREGVEIRYCSPPVGFIGDARRVEGVRVLAPDGEYTLMADAVILCAGGFQADPAKRAQYLPPNADLMKVRGSRHDTGEVLMMALDLGARASGQWQGAHASPIAGDAPAFDGPERPATPVSTIRYSYVLGITVNALGQRFIDEGEAESVYTYAKTGFAILAQPGGTAHQLFDARLEPYLRPQYREIHWHEAQTMGELAQKMGVKPENLERTVNEFNAAIEGDIPFTPRARDGKHTVGLSPNKSNWATPLDTPPYRAYPVTGGITFSFGGLAVNENAQVMNKMWRPIQGLYASGDILGLFYHNYPSFTGQTRNVVFARRAAGHAVANMGKAPPP